MAHSSITGLVLLSLPLLVHAEQPRLTILTYNIHIGIGLDKKADLDRTAAVIKAAAPDLVALQEVDRKTRRSNGVDQASDLARATGMYMVFGKALALDPEGGEYGVAILSRLPIRRSQNRQLPNTPGFEPRTVLEVEFDWPLPSGKRIPIRFFNTHFDHRSEPDRIASAKVLNQLALASDIPAILAGDLNARPGAQPLQILSEQWQFAGAGADLPTFPANGPRAQIDFMLYRPAQSWKVVEAVVIDEPVASDHRPVKVVLEPVLR